MCNTLAINISMIPILNNPHDSLTPEEISSFKKYLTIENFISDGDCDKLVELGEQSVVSAVKKHTFTNIMQMDHCFLPKNDPIHRALMPAWEQALSYFNIDVDFIEPYKLQRYTVGGYFGRHIDNYHGLNLPQDRKISVTLQLSNDHDYEGGNFLCGTHKISRKKGSLTFFPSFYPHMVEKVTAGTRWSLIGWAWGPYWR